TLCKGRLEGFH
ncbi:unnamed protein product, partial [Allacma fusca]